VQRQTDRQTEMLNILILSVVEEMILLQLYNINNDNNNNNNNNSKNKNNKD
jgi:hypothetical protein